MSLIHESLAAVMQAVDHVAKRDVNQQQGFIFRGIDAVLNAVGPALREHGILVIPRLLTVTYVTVRLTSGKDANACRVIVEYRFVATDGSQVKVRAPGEAFDMGDKATPKAMSVAFRTALIQALALPTDEPDPDHSTFAAAPPRPTTADAIAELERLADAAGMDLETLTAKWRHTNADLPVEALPLMSVEALAPLIAAIRAYVEPPATAAD